MNDICDEEPDFLKKNYYICIIYSKTRHICDRYEQKPKTKNTWIRKGGFF